MNVEPFRITLSGIVTEIDGAFKMKLSKAEHETMMAIISKRLVRVQSAEAIPDFIVNQNGFKSMMNRYKQHAIGKMTDALKEHMIERVQKKDKTNVYNYEIYVLEVGKNVVQ